MIGYHIIALAAGVILDLIIGDPYWMPHPIRLIGRFIGWLDRRALPEEIRSRTDGTDEAAAGPARDQAAERRKGRLIVLAVTVSTFLVTGAIIVGAYLIYPWAGCAVEAILTAYILAAASLRRESMKVCTALLKGDVTQARRAVSMIVGRDTEALDSEGIAKAAVETVAENTSDGVIAPFLYTVIGGPILGMLYKSVNTMDSMIGYKNNRYIDLGRAAARLDDVVNFIPARVSAWLIIFAAFIVEHFGGGKRHLYSASRAVKIFKRDRFNHKSPNSAQTESAVAGALGVMLAGDAYYFGKKVSKPTIGDAMRSVEPEDIRRTNKLMYIAYLAAAIICTGVWVIIYFTIR